MKKIVSLFAVTLAVMAISVNSFAQRMGGQDNGWWDRMKSEKIAFLTSEMDLTPSEAQAFWPIYNQADKERFNLQEAVFTAFRNLDEAVKAGKSDKELTDLVKAYAKANSDVQSVDSKYINEYLKVIPGTKVAKLFVGEEKFRQQQIFRLRRGPQQGNTAQGNRANKSQDSK